MPDDFKQYRRKITDGELRPYVPGEDLSKTTVNPRETPKEGDWIARDPQDRDNQWLVTAEYFEKHYESEPMDFDRPPTRREF